MQFPGNMFQRFSASWKALGTRLLVGSAMHGLGSPAAFVLAAVLAVSGCAFPHEDDATALKPEQAVQGDIAFHFVAGPDMPDAVTLPILSPDSAGTRTLALQPDAVVGNTQVATVALDADHSGRMTLDLRLDKEGARRLREATAENVGQRLAVVADGQVISDATIMSEIPGPDGRLQISGLEGDNAMRLYEALTRAP